MNIAVLLSGGVDSSVVVHLLCEQGYRPSLFLHQDRGGDDADYMDCSAEEDMEMASAIRPALWIIVGSSGPAPGVLGPGGGLCH